MPDYIKCHSNAFTLTPDGRYWITAVYKLISIYDTKTGEQIGKSLIGHENNSVRSLTVSPNGKYFISTGGCFNDSNLIIWDFETRCQIKKITGNFFNLVTSITFICDGQYIIIHSGVFVIRILSMKTFNQVWIFDIGVHLHHPLVTITDSQIFIHDRYNDKLTIIDNPIVILRRTLAKYIIPDLANLVEWAI